MFLFAKGSAASILCTLNEKAALDSPFYHFAFTNPVTGKTIEFTLDSQDDLSPYPDRYNEFQITVNDHFQNEPSGFYDYIIYEKQTADEDPETIVERGLMKLIGTSTAAVSYTPEASTIKVYNGE